jgi:predicted DNA-binding transcriptional regulator AlpA
MGDVLKLHQVKPLDPFGRLLTEKAVCEMVGYSKTSIYRMQTRDRNPFPMQTKDPDNGGRSLWVEMDVIMWKAREIADRTGKPLSDVLAQYRSNAAFLLGSEDIPQELIDH